MAASGAGNAVPFKINPNVTYASCDTDMAEIKFGFIWTIRKFSYLKEKCGQWIASPDFTPNEDDKSKWYLALYPKGLNEEYEDCISLFLHNIPDEPYQVTFEISILNNKREKCYLKKQSIPKTFTRTSAAGRNGWGFNDYISRNNLMNGSEVFMQNDELVVCCEGVIYTQHRNYDLRYNQILVEDSARGLLEDLRRLHLESKNAGDVILVAEGKELRVHKLILSARSPVFAAMIRHDMEEKQQNRVVISDVDYNVLEELIRFMYTGKMPATDEKMAMLLLAAADKYGLEDLKMMCEQALSINVRAENVANLVTLASLHNADRLKNSLVEFMLSFGSKDVIKCLWKDIISRHPQVIARAFEDCEQ